MGAVLCWLALWATIMFSTFYLVMEPNPVDRAKKVRTQPVKRFDETVNKAIDNPWKFLTDNLVSLVAVFLFLVALIVVKNSYNSAKEFGANIATEFIGIAITVVVIDRLYQMRSRRQYREEIFEQLRSKVPGSVHEAIRLAGQNDWLTDGSFNGIDLLGVHFEGADLIKANLQGANLFGAHLNKANLPGANLQDANLMGAILEGAILVGANLQDANLMGANLQNAIYSTGPDEWGLCAIFGVTVWPDGFDPKAVGALAWNEMSED